MTSRKKRRLIFLCLGMLGLGAAGALTLTAMSDNLVFFIPPSDVATKAVPGRPFRLGGLVEIGSVEKVDEAGRPLARFRVTDGPATITVTYGGILPDLFREGQGIVALGALQPDGTFRATEVLAKHDETYMPPEVADALRRTGHWNPEAGAPPPPSSEWNSMQPARSSSQ